MRNEDKSEKQWCPRCPTRPGRLLPLRKGTLVCVECGYQAPDVCHVTEHMGQGDFASAAGYARQLRDLRKAQDECQHKHVMVAVRPWCSDCGMVLPPSNQMAQAALRRIGKPAPELEGGEGKP